MKCVKLTYKSPVFGSVQCEDLPNENERCIEFGPDTAMRLLEKSLQVDMFLEKCVEDLTFAVPEELQELVVKAMFGRTDECYSELYFLTEIYVREEPTEEQHRQIFDWISGQMSDGWGEGVELKEAYEEELTFEALSFNEDECKYEHDTQYVDVCYYFRPWSADARWHIELVGREPAELDTEESNTNEELRKAVLKIKELIDEVVDELKKIT